MSQKIILVFVVTILLISFTIGCTNPSSEKSPEKNPPTSFPNNGHYMPHGTIPVYVCTEDESNIEGNVNITIWVDNITVIQWNHQISKQMITPNLGPSNATFLKNGTHTLSAFEKNTGITNTTLFNLTQEKYLAVVFWHSNNPNNPSDPKLEICVSDSPFGWD
jgi:hypothetical protein